MVRRKAEPSPVRTNRAPPQTPQDRESQLASDAFDLARKQILEGTASAQVITAAMKMGSLREQLEKQKIEFENRLLEEKRKQMESEQRVESLYLEALNAMRVYGGHTIPDHQLNEIEYDDPNVF